MRAGAFARSLRYGLVRLLRVFCVYRCARAPRVCVCRRWRRARVRAAVLVNAYIILRGMPRSVTPPPALAASHAHTRFCYRTWTISILPAACSFTTHRLFMYRYAFLLHAHRRLFCAPARCTSPARRTGVCVSPAACLYHAATACCRAAPPAHALARAAGFASSRAPRRLSRHLAFAARAARA